MHRYPAPNLLQPGGGPRGASFTWEVEQSIVLRVEPRGPHFRWREPSASRTLSRFAYLRSAGSTWVLESPQAACRITNLSPRAAATLVSNRCDSQFDEQLYGILDAAGFTAACEEIESWQWEFHDRLFHAGSTRNAVDEPYGATFRFAADRPFPQAPEPAPAIALSPPDASVLNLPVARAFAARRSVRRHGERPIDLCRVSDLLYLSFRREAAEAAGPIPRFRKPYPSAGGVHELCAYLVVRACTGLEPGIYRYHDAAHGLTRLQQSSALSGRVIQSSSFYWGAPEAPPQMVLLLTARLDRLAWKYEKLTYRLALLNAGCAMQTICLAASALGLACCPLGGINQMLFSIIESWKEIEGVPVAKLALGAE